MELNHIVVQYAQLLLPAVPIASVSFKSLILKDQRPPSQVREVAVVKQLSLNYSQKTAQKIVLQVDTTKVNFVPEFLLSFLDFTNDGLQHLVPPEAPAAADAVKSTSRPPPEATKPSALEVTLSISHIFVLLFQDPNKEVTNKLLLHLSVFGHVELGDRTFMSACVENCQITQQFVNHSKTEKRMLEPVDLTVQLGEKDGQLGFELTPVFINFSVLDQGILVGASNSLIVAQENSAKRKATSAPIAAPVESKVVVVKKKKPENIIVSVNVVANQFIITLINENPEIPPLARLKMFNLRCLGQYPTELSASAISITGAYYNLERAAWEPLIEQWIFGIKVSRKK